MSTTLLNYFSKSMGQFRNRAVACLAIAAFSGILAHAQTPNKVVGYWLGSGTPNVARLTHLNYAFATIVSYTVNNQTRYTCHLNNAATLASQFQAFKATNPKLKILISVGGANQPPAMFTAASQDSTFASGCVANTLGALSGSADGLDIDWEFPGTTDSQNFVNLMTALRAALPQNGLLTAAIGMGPTNNGAAAQNANTPLTPAVLSLMDYLNIMTYDAYSGAASTFGAPLYASNLSGYGTYNGTVNDTISDLINNRHVPSGMLVLGIPFYGNYYSRVQAAGNNFGIYEPPAAGFTVSQIPYSQIATMAGGKHCDTGSTAPGACGRSLILPLSGSQEAWLFDPNTLGVTTFDDTGSIAAKVKYATDNKLGGMMIWELMQDTSDHALLAALASDMPTGVVNTSPTADSVTPATGSGTSATFAFKYSRGSAFQYPNLMYALINGSLSGSTGCLAVYIAGSNGLYLYNDAGNALTGPLTPGAAGSLTNSQCTINGTGTTVTGTGSSLTLSLAVSFKPGFVGLKTLYGYVSDDGNQNSGWATLGTWSAGTVVNTPPTADSVTPSTGKGTAQNFSFKFSSANGYQYLNLAYALINGSLSGSAGCFPLFLVGSNGLYLYNDAGTALTGPLTPGAAGTLSNSQCTINGPGTSAVGSGNTLNLTLAVTFKAGFSGTKTLYGYAVDNGSASGWAILGTWTTSPVINTPPTADSVTPASGSGSGAHTFAFKYSSANGYQYVNVAYALINGSLSASQGCVPVYLASTNGVYLYNDAGTALSGPLTAGGTLSNSQCSIAATGTSAAGSGNTLTLTLAVTFKAGFSGTKTLYGYAADNGNQNSGWKSLGTWTLP